MSLQSLFFYGTLRHVPLLERVIGRPVADLTLSEATLADHAVTWVKDQPFPMIAKATGSVAHGLVVSGLTLEDVSRLDFYEGGFAYDLRMLDAQTGQGAQTVRVYVPQEGVWTPGAAFDLDDWVARWAAITLEAATEIMARFGLQPATEVQTILPFIRARAWARVMAGHPAPQELRRKVGPGAVEILRERPSYHGFFHLRALDLRHRRFDGSWSEPMGREIFGAFDAALVLPYDPSTDHVLLIEQLRFGPIQRGDPAPWVLEPIAGLVDAGEDPAVCALRETREEAHLTLSDLHFMTRAYASPGYSSEFFHFYLGLADLSAFETGVAGLDTEHEDIRSHVLPFDAAMALVDSGEINAAPLAMMLLWLARHREALRSSA